MAQEGKEGILVAIGQPQWHTGRCSDLHDILHKAHISDPNRLSRLLIASCLAYIWVIYLGSLGEQDDWVRVIHRGDRCDLNAWCEIV
jgi:hypothetical protein